MTATFESEKALKYFDENGKFDFCRHGENIQMAKNRQIETKF